jgi:hypothetical protein
LRPRARTDLRVIPNYKEGIMKNALFLMLIFLSACAPNESAIKVTVQAAMAQTQSAIPTVTITVSPIPTSSPMPIIKSTNTIEPTIATTTEPTLNANLILVANLLKRTYSDDIDSITAIRRGVNSLEIELTTKLTSAEGQPRISFDAIQTLATIFGQLSEARDLNLFVTGIPPHFSILLTTYSIDRNYKYSSLTYYDALVKLYNK